MLRALWVIGSTHDEIKPMKKQEGREGGLTHGSLFWPLKSAKGQPAARLKLQIPRHAFTAQARLQAARNDK
jgi:hypothetical protein